MRGLTVQTINPISNHRVNNNFRNKAHLVSLNPRLVAVVEHAELAVEVLLVAQVV
jgi:hypothetical protein